MIDHHRESIPKSVYILGVGIFCLATSEFMIAGLLPNIAPDLGTTIPGASLLITAFAVGMIIGAPLMAIATLGMPRRTVLITVSLVFSALHVTVYLTDDFTIIAISRVLSAFACGAFWAVGAVLAVRLSPPSMTGRALAVMAAGLTLANVAGVPLGTWVGQQFGWRSAFAAIAILTLATAATIALFVPPSARENTDVKKAKLVKHELIAFTSRHVWLTLATTALFQGAMFCAFTYFAPLITDEAGFSPSAVPMILAAFGVGSFIGITVGGRLADSNIFGTIFVGLTLMSLSLLAVAASASNQIALPIAITAVGATGYIVAPALNARIFAIAGAAPTLAAAVNTSAFNVGNALGPALGAVAVTAAGYRMPAYVAVVVTLLALAVTAVAYRESRIEAVRETELVSA
ncbi:MFS transporter [Hoyosella rhizosphaerae]|uniref:Chloramphenicol efflux pump n=1 Tax=Hoyosella rhizosphaerae TaxID=1755582 RepID=A0A916UDU7_9ACTN|nr:Cmx/CmrA family chloramphenicol efflux MFS transporter [Hoyosella rhizosphaerae]MBN4925700.1 MFS transporter [Hoyosella rhizosphaerae]GGC68622.1 chloramphenicol efflux pump [Hoyosella rhizosphaerae]